MQERCILMDGVEVYLDPDGEIEFSCEENDIELEWSPNGSDYYRISEEQEGTYMFYTVGEGVDGCHMYQKGGQTIVNRFSTME